jgi:hypothetical protein
MPHNPQALLEDVRQAAQLIHDFTVGRSPTDYTTDAMLHAAVEREFIIIGEALSRLEKLDAALTVQHLRCRLPRIAKSSDSATSWFTVMTPSTMPLFGK